MWEGHRIVALWDADARYTTQKAGYHGGVALAEVTIPVLAFLPFGAEPPKGWRELGDQRPAWWSLEPVPAQAVPPSSPPASARQHQHPNLCRMRSWMSEEPAVTLTAALLASSIFKGQVELLGRKPPLDKIETAVTVLLEAGTLPTTALAAGRLPAQPCRRVRRGPPPDPQLQRCPSLGDPATDTLCG